MSEEMPMYRIELTGRQREMLQYVLRQISAFGYQTHQPTAVRLSRELQSVAERLRSLEPITERQR